MKIFIGSRKIYYGTYFRKSSLICVKLWSKVTGLEEVSLRIEVGAARSDCGGERAGNVTPYAFEIKFSL